MLGDFGSAGIGACVEADDDGVGGDGEGDVIFSGPADGGVDDGEFDVVGGKGIEGFGEGFEGSLDVGLDDDVEIFVVAELCPRVEFALGEFGVSLSFFDLRGEFFCDFFDFCDEERLAGIGDL